MQTKNTRRIMVDTWTTNKYYIYNESETKQYQNESSFQKLYSNINSTQGFSPKVLCIIEGCWSKNNAESVNGRFYGDLFWDKQLVKEEVQYLLRNGLMWMMFGHVDRGIEDKDAEKGLVAGIVTHLEVIKEPITIHGKDYGIGDLFGRAIIIDMEAGRNTYTLLSVGSQLSISSRGLGEYVIGETHQCENGNRIPIMDSNTYELETFDFTRLPGIQCAEVHMVEDNQKNEHIDISTDENDEDEFMYESLEIDDSLAHRIKESKNNLIFNIQKKESKMAKVNGIEIQQVLEDANAKIASLTAKLEAAEEEVKKAEEERDNAKAECDRMKKEAEIENHEAPEKSPEEEEKAGIAEEDKAELEQFRKIAESPEELSDTLDKADDTIRKCEEDMEEFEEIKKEKEKLEEDCKDAEEVLESYLKIGTIQDIQEAQKVLESYVKLGSIKELKSMVESNKQMKLEARKQKIKAFTEHYSNKKGITQESVKRIIESSKSIKDAKMILESLPNKSIDSSLYRGKSIENMGKSNNVLKSFAESFIDKAEKRRNKNYTV